MGIPNTACAPERSAASQSRDRPDVYVAASWREVERAKQVAERLRREGLKVWAFWEEHPEPLARDLEAWEAGFPDGPPPDALGDRLWRAKLDCLLAIREAGIVVLVEPAGNDAHNEAGFALGQDVPVVRLGRGRPGLMTFDAPVAEDLDALVLDVGALLGRPALPRELREGGPA